MTSSSKTLSTQFSRTILLIVMFILGINSLLVSGAQYFELPFKTVSIVSLIFTVLSLVAVFAFTKPRIEIKDYGVLVALIVLGLLGSELGLVTNRSDTDDYYYAANAVYYLNHPDETMNFEVHALRGLTDDPVVSVGQGVSTPYDYFRGIIAYFTGINYLNIYYFYSLALFGFLIPVVNFWVMSKFTEDTRLALLGTILILCVLFILTETHRTFGNFAFPRIYQGKSVAFSVGIPTYVALSISYFSKPSIFKWLALSMTIIAVVGMSTSAALLFSILAAVLAFSYFAVEFTNQYQSNAILQLIKNVFLYMMTISYAVLYALFLIFQQRSTNTNSFQLGGADSFSSHLDLLINRDLPLTPWLIAISVILLILYNGKHKRFLLYWILTLTIFVANPLVAKFLIGDVIPRNIYWRVFYLGPFPLLVGVIFIFIAQRYKLKLRNAIPITVLAMTISLGYYFYHFSKLDQLHFPPSYKLPAEQVAIAEKVTEVAPGGVMLAPPEIYGIIPMLDSNYPQARTRRDGNIIWLGPEERALREQASLFLDGDDQYQESFFQLLNQGFIDVIVFTSNPAPSVTESLIREYGYEQTLIEDCCIIYFR